MMNRQRLPWHFQSSAVVPVVTQSASAEQASWHILALVPPSSLLQALIVSSANSNAKLFMGVLL
jgi:16S rRNA C1402 (ribose-2'-O) methylase RsmI